MAFIDPVFAYAAPEAAKAFGETVRETVVLPDAGTSAALYASLDATRPSWVFLSPLLASEINGILSRDESTRVAYLGDASPSAAPRLCTATFSSVDASRLAGARAAAESMKATGLDAFGVGAVFVEREAADAFVAAYSAAGGQGESFVEMAPYGFSQAAADRLKALDIRVGYVSASPKDSERWVRQAFDQYAFVLAEFPLPSERPVSAADALVAWDMDATLSVLHDVMTAGRDGNSPGIWRFLLLPAIGGLE